MKPPPLLSIATCVLNAKEDFIETARSLPATLPPWAEWIVVDGGSSDGTRETAGRDARVARLVSEPDAGVYDAYNKALALSAGAYVWYLNAGDKADPTAFPMIGDRIEAAATRGAPALAFAVDMRSGAWIWHPAPERIAEEMSLPTPGVLFPRAALQAAHGFDTSYRIAADYDLLLRLHLRHAIRFETQSEVLVHYKGGGLSARQRQLGFFEECVAQLRQTPDYWPRCLLRAARRAVFEIDTRDIKEKRWKLALRLGRRFLY